MRSLVCRYPPLLFGALLLVGVLGPTWGQGAGQPQLFLTLTVDRPTAAPGDMLTYTAAVTNNSGSAVSQATVFVPLPAGTQFVDASNGGTLSGDTVVWGFDSLAPGQGSVVAFRAQVGPGAVAGTLLQTQAQLAVPAQGTIVSSNVVTTTVAPPNARLTLVMTVDRAAARPGDPLTYTLTYANVGPTTADGVAILAPLPPGLNFLGAQSNVQIDVATRTLRFDLGSLPVGATGSVSFRAQVDTAVPAGNSITNQAQIIGATLAQPVLSNPVTVGVVAASYAGTYKLILLNPADPTSVVPNPTSITVDPQSKFTVTTVPGDKATPSLGAQGALRADGSFDVTTASGRVRFTGRIDQATQTATVTVQRAGLAPYTVVLPRAPDFATLPDALVGTFLGLATNAAGDQLRVRMTIDPVGNATFDGDLIELFPVNLRWRVGSYQVTPSGQLGFGGQTDGIIQASGNSLVLVYNFTGDGGYQSTFQVPLARQ